MVELSRKVAREGSRRGLNPTLIEARSLAVRAGKRMLLQGIDLTVPCRSVSVLVGPSGVGKSTLLRCFNRLIELSPGLEMSGDILFRASSIFHPSVDVDDLRARIGMLFQQPAVFPCSIRDNVLFGARRLQRLDRRQSRELREEVLISAGLWDEVKDRLAAPGLSLSVGQQQRLCLARALAVRPEVLLLDEPTSALDPKATEKIEELIVSLGRHRALVLVTHDHAQAERVGTRILSMELRQGVGEIVETESRPKSENSREASWKGRR